MKIIANGTNTTL